MFIVEADLDPAKVVEWLESDEGEDWSRFRHWDGGLFYTPSHHFAEFKSLHDLNAISEMCFSEQGDIWWTSLNSQNEYITLPDGWNLPPERV